jgi:crossover junction endodeoxyribonuclease RusA
LSRTYVIRLPYPPVSGNRMSRAGRGRHYTPPVVRDYRDRVAAEVRSLGLRCQLPGPLRVEYTVAPPDRRARDADNVIKMVNDALTLAGFWLDDSNRVLVEYSYRWLDPLPGGSVVVEVLS